jgi:hypothetical protein
LSKRSSFCDEWNRTSHVLIAELTTAHDMGRTSAGMGEQVRSAGRTTLQVPKYKKEYPAFISAFNHISGLSNGRTTSRLFLPSERRRKQPQENANGNLIPEKPAVRNTLKR